AYIDDQKKHSGQLSGELSLKGRKELGEQLSLADLIREAFETRVLNCKPRSWRVENPFHCGPVTDDGINRLRAEDALATPVSNQIHDRRADTLLVLRLFGNHRRFA